MYPGDPVARVAIFPVRQWHRSEKSRTCSRYCHICRIHRFGADARGMMTEAVSYGLDPGATVFLNGHCSGTGLFPETAVRETRVRGDELPSLRNRIITGERAVHTGRHVHDAGLPPIGPIRYRPPYSGQRQRIRRGLNPTTNYRDGHGKSSSRYTSPCVQSIDERLMRFKPACAATSNRYASYQVGGRGDDLSRSPRPECWLGQEI